MVHRLTILLLIFHLMLLSGCTGPEVADPEEGALFADYQGCGLVFPDGNPVPCDGTASRLNVEEDAGWPCAYEVPPDLGMQVRVVTSPDQSEGGIVFEQSGRQTIHGVVLIDDGQQRLYDWETTQATGFVRFPKELLPLRHETTLHIIIVVGDDVTLKASAPMETWGSRWTLYEKVPWHILSVEAGSNIYHFQKVTTIAWQGVEGHYSEPGFVLEGQDFRLEVDRMVPIQATTTLVSPWADIQCDPE